MNRGHVLPIAGGSAKPGARAGVGQVAADAELLEVIKHVLGLSMGENHFAVIPDVNEVMRREGVIRFDIAKSGLADSPQAEDNTWWDRLHFMSRSDGIDMAETLDDADRV